MTNAVTASAIFLVVLACKPWVLESRGPSRVVATRAAETFDTSHLGSATSLAPRRRFGPGVGGKPGGDSQRANRPGRRCACRRLLAGTGSPVAYTFGSAYRAAGYGGGPVLGCRSPTDSVVWHERRRAAGHRQCRPRLLKSDNLSRQHGALPQSIIVARRVGNWLAGVVSTGSVAHHPLPALPAFHSKGATAGSANGNRTGSTVWDATLAADMAGAGTHFADVMGLLRPGRR